MTCLTTDIVMAYIIRHYLEYWDGYIYGYIYV